MSAIGNDDAFEQIYSEIVKTDGQDDSEFAKIHWDVLKSEGPLDYDDKFESVYQGIETSPVKRAPKLQTIHKEGFIYSTISTDSQGINDKVEKPTENAQIPKTESTEQTPILPTIPVNPVQLRKVPTRAPPMQKKLSLDSSLMLKSFDLNLQSSLNYESVYQHRLSNRWSFDRKPDNFTG